MASPTAAAATAAAAASSDTSASFESPSKKAKREATGLKERLVSSSSKPEIAAFILDQIEFAFDPFLSKELQMLCDRLGILLVVEDEDADVEEEGTNKVYKLPDDCSEILGNNVRDSRLYVERGSYPLMFDEIMKLWSPDKQNKILSIILTGNPGTGKSWFQVYFLRRLLTEYSEDGDNCRFRFVLRHVGENDFQFLDLQNCQGWIMKERTHLVKSLLRAIEKVLYLYEPGDAKDIGCPIVVSDTPSLSTLSPNPKRIKEYKKQARPVFVYMPVWKSHDLELVVKHEKNFVPEHFDFEKQHALFGGIIRRTLEYNKLTMADYKAELDKRIKRVDTGVLRSMHLGLDDNCDAQLQDNISGYIAAYADIPQTGVDAFVKKELMMTSTYACIEVDKTLRLKSPLAHAKALAKCLSKEIRDITGSDLEVSAAHMVALGTQTLKWFYHCAGGPQKPPLNAIKLANTKMGLHRGENIEVSKLNYPSDSIYGLVDFFLFIKEVCWAFQTTWQDSHAFKLCTLLSFRKRIGVAENKKLNIVFVVPPDKLDTYRKRAKEKYLVKGEDANKPIYGQRGKLLLGATNVKEMWDSTNIFVAFPEQSWESAVKTLIQELQL